MDACRMPRLSCPSSVDRIYAFTLTIALSEVTFSELAGLAMRAPKHHARLHPTPKQRVAAVTQLFLAGNAESSG